MTLFIRASTASDANTHNSQKLVLDGLTYQPSSYYYLKIFNETTGVSYTVSSNGGGSSGNYFSTAYTFAVSSSTTNVYRAEAKYLSSSALTTVYANLTSPSPPHTQVPNQVNVSVSDVGGGAFYANLSGGAYSETVHVEVRKDNASGAIAFSTSVGVGTTPVVVSGLKEFTDYYVKAWGTNVVGVGAVGTTTTTTLDKTAPSISATYDGNGRMFINFDGADVIPSGANASGLDYYRVWISPRNSSSLDLGFDVTNLANSYFTFETDANGLNFVHNSYYTLGVKSRDKSGNWSVLASQSVTFINSRPVNWNWTTAKVANASVNVTASDWESLGKAINKFRTYKSLVVRNFTVPSVNDEITATIFNQYCNAIREINPPTQPPSNKSAGSIMLASDFMLLSTSLNSIT